MNDTTRLTVDGHDAGARPGAAPDGRWGAVFLAALPYGLILLADGLPKALVETGLLTYEAAGMGILNTALAVVLGGVLLAIFILAWRRRWPLWSAAWLLFFCVPPLVLAVGGLSLLADGKLNFTIHQDWIMYLATPLLIATLLYSAARRDPRRGLLAAWPVLYLLWNNNMEFVPDWIELAIKVPSIALICLAIAFTLRRADWRAGLLAVLAVNLVVGALFAYAGIYHGGTLPYVAPGPNLVEVARSLIPQYLATGAILLGPLFAWKFRQAGSSGGLAGKIAYHLTLLALLLVIMTNLAGLMLTLRISSPIGVRSASSGLVPLVAVGMAVYLASALWLYRCAPAAGTGADWLERGLLLLLPLAIPLTFMLTFITWLWPVSGLYGIPLLWTLPHALSLSLGLAWLGLSVWVVTRAGTPRAVNPAYNSMTDPVVRSM